MTMACAAILTAWSRPAMKSCSQPATYQQFCANIESPRRGCLTVAGTTAAFGGDRGSLRDAGPDASAPGLGSGVDGSRPPSASLPALIDYCGAPGPRAADAWSPGSRRPERWQS